MKTKNLPKGARPFRNCSIEIAKLPVGLFVLRSDKRKRMYNARMRQYLLTKMSGFADSDGGNCYPSIATLSEATGWGHSQVCHYLGQLEKLGFVISDGYAWENGPRKRRLVISPRVKAGVRDSKGDSAIGKQDSGIEDQDSGLEKQDSGLDRKQPVSLDPPEENPSVSQPGAGRTDFSKQPKQDWEEFVSEHGAQLAERALQIFQDDPEHDHQKIRNPKRVFLRQAAKYVQQARQETEELERNRRTQKLIDRESAEFQKRDAEQWAARQTERESLANDPIA